MRNEGFHRRGFLRGGLAATAGALAARLGRAEVDEPRVRRKRKLGRTGLEVSDISMGTGSTANADVVRHALDRGINFIDTAESYPLGFPGAAERAVGKAIVGRRDGLVLSSKTQAGPRERRQALMERLEASLARLGTDRIDLYFNHAVNDVARLDNPEWLEFASRAKQEGKIRYVGMSGHGGRLIECLDHAIENRQVDVILAAYNFGSDPKFYERFTRSSDLVATQPGLPAVLAKARAAGIGVVVMKTLLGAKLNDMRPYEWGGASFAQAAFRWVFSNDDVDALVVSMKRPEQIDEYLRASGDTRPLAGDGRLLRGYLAAHGATQCRLGCGDCTSACPAGVPISDVLRARMYAEDYAELSAGRATYAELETDASACASCVHQACAAACSYGLDVPERTRTTPDLLGIG